MILLFVILLILVGLLAQKYVLTHSHDAVESDYWPEQNIVEPEEEFDMVISLKNKTKRTLHYIRAEHTYYRGISVSARVNGVYRDPGTGSHMVKCSTWLKPGQHTLLKIPISISERGRYVFFHPKVYLGDFLGLTEIIQDVNRFREIVVAPKEWEQPEWKEVLGNFLGDYSVRRFLYEDPVLTIGFREYTGREPMKMISWTQSARRQSLMVKEYDHTIEPVISVLLNIESDTADREDVLEKCFSLTRSVCQMLEEQGISYDFYTNALQAGSAGDDYMINEGLGKRHFEKILESLGRSMYKPMFSFEKLFELAETFGGKDRGKIIVTPTEEDLGFVYQSSNSSHHILILEASKR